MSRTPRSDRPVLSSPARRRFTAALGSGTALSVVGGVGGAVALSGCATQGPAAAAGTGKQARVLVIGAGYGGATAAKYLRKWGGTGIDVTLVDRESAFVSCPLSNLVLGGSRTIASLTVPYTGLRRAGINVVQDEVTAIDVARRSVSFAKLTTQTFDRIVVSPGIDLDFDAVQGFDARATRRSAARLSRRA